MTLLHEAFTKFADSLRQLARAICDAFKPYLDALNRWAVRRRHSKRHKALHKVARSRRKVTPAKFIPVRRHPHRRQAR